MDKRNNLVEVRRELITLLIEKEKKDNQIKNLQNKIVQILCPTKKKECEPAYCAFRITVTCPFISEWRVLLEETQIKKN